MLKKQKKELGDFVCNMSTCFDRSLRVLTDRLSCWDRQRCGLGSMFGLLYLFLFWSHLHIAHQHGVLLLFSSQPQSSLSLSLRSVDFLLTSIFSSGLGTDIVFFLGLAKLQKLCCLVLNPGTFIVLAHWLPVQRMACLLCLYFP